MNSPFKFLRRVRIHGGECGAVARALHHEVKGLSLYQADLEKSSGSTNERKQMSTKTTFKRMALVVVAAMGFGVLTTVAPATAALPSDKGLVSAVSFGDTTQSSRATVARVGVSTSNTIRITVGSNLTPAAATEIDTFVNFKSVPAAETVLGVSAASTGGPVLTATAVAAGSLMTAANTAAVVNQSGVTPGNLRIALGIGSSIVKGSALPIGTATWTPAVVGTYVLQAWVDDATSGNTAGNKDAAERAATKTVVVGGTPTTIVATVLNASSVVGTLPGDNDGTVIQVSVKDAAGNLTSLLPGESVGVTKSAGTGTISDASLTAADFNVNGYHYVVISGTATQTGTFAFAASGFTATTVSHSVTGTLQNANPVSYTFTQTTGVTAGSGIVTSVTTAQTIGTADRAVTFATGKAVTLRVTSGSSASATSRVIAVSINDDYGIVTGDDTGGVDYNTSVSIDDTLGYGSITLPTSGLSDTESITVTLFQATGAAGATITLTAADVAISSTSTLSPAAASVVTGGGIELTAQCLDQHSQAVANCAVAWSVSGRNATTTPTQKLADANGYSTYILTDTSTSTTSLTSTVSATMTWGTSTNTETASVTFGAGNAPATVTVTTSPTKTVTTTESEISTAATGPEGGAVTLAFTVKDAAGTILVGTPVTFTANSTNVSWKSSSTDTSNRQLVYTDSSGVATTYIAGWVAPSTVTVTATAGTITATTTINLVTKAADARTIALTTSGGIVKATVKDRFGNPTKGATVNWSRVGTGYFGSGVSATTGTTDVNGEAEILFIGDGTIKAELAVATYAQCDDASGKVGTTSTSGTGASLAPAGNCSATSAVTGSKDSATKAADAATAAAEAATDAAAEAIDAANAATDAANLSAEAADAATVAAEEARDAADAATAAVEELATQVATLMAALKAQITTLANTVAKIAKKVKA